MLPLVETLILSIPLMEFFPLVKLVLASMSLCVLSIPLMEFLILPYQPNNILEVLDFQFH